MYMSQIITQVNNTFTTTKQDLTQIFKSLDNLVTEATLTLDHEGLTCRCMDPSHVSLIDMSIISHDFETYNIEDEIEISLNVKEFLKILKELDNDAIIISIKKDTIELDQNGFNFKVNRLENSDHDCPIPKIPYDSEISFPGLENLEIVKTFRKINSLSDYITFESIDKRLELSGSGDNGKTSITLDESKVLVLSNNDSISTYSLEYIVPFLKSMHKKTKVKMQFSSTKPIRIETNIGAQSRIHFYLAPRVEN